MVWKQFWYCCDNSEIGALFKPNPTIRGGFAGGHTKNLHSSDRRFQQELETGSLLTELPSRARQLGIATPSGPNEREVTLGLGRKGLGCCQGRPKVLNLKFIVVL